MSITYIRKQKSALSRTYDTLGKFDMPGRIWGGSGHTSGVQKHTLPKTHPKYRPQPGTKRFMKSNDAQATAKQSNGFKKWDVSIGKYVYALTKPKGDAGKGWVKA